MVTFDLERAKIGIPVRTRDGRKGVFCTHLQGSQPAPLLFDIWSLYDSGEGLEDDPNNTGNLENYYLNGRHETVHDSPLDLFMEY